MKGMKRTFFQAFPVLLLAAGTVIMAGCNKTQTSGAGASGGVETLKILASENQRTISEGTVLSMSDWYTGKVPSKIWDTFVAELAKRGLKLDLELVLYDQIDTTLNTTLASGQWNNYDWIGVGKGMDAEQLYGMIRQNRLYAINKLVQEHSAGPAKEWFSSGGGQVQMKANSVEDGNTYWMFSLSRGPVPGSPTGSTKSGMIRWDWLQELGLPMPTTLDEFYNAVTAFREKDMNGNGVKDEVIGIEVDNFTANSIAWWFGLGDGLVFYRDGQALSPWYMPHIKDYFTYLNKLYKAGVIEVSGEGNAMAANRIAYFTDWSAEDWVEPGITVPAGKPPAYFAPFVIQANPDTPARVQQGAPIGTGISEYMGFVPAGTKKAAALGKLLDYMVTPEYGDISGDVILGYTYNLDAAGALEKITQKSGAFVGLDYDYNFTQNRALWAGWMSFFPSGSGTARPSNLLQQSQEIIAGARSGYPLKAQWDIDMRINGKYLPIRGTSPSIPAYATLDETSRLGAIRPDLSTYSSELSTALIMGEKSLDNWDAYLADLKRLGLDEYISILQAQVDRGK